MDILSDLSSRAYTETREPERAIITFHQVWLTDDTGGLIIVEPEVKTKLCIKSNLDLSAAQIDDILDNNYDYFGSKTVHQNDFQYKVMFNPSSIKLMANGGGLVEKVTYNKNDKVNDHTEATKVVNYIQNERRNMIFNVNLIFDQVNPSDAFSQVNPFELSGSVASVKNAVLNNAVNKSYSVQKDVEGFLSSCRRPETRHITFTLGSMSYTGVLYQVSAQYTMFNPNGEPIRAVVYFQMTLIDSTLGYGDMGQFTNSFKKVFGLESVSLNTFKNMTSGLINFDL